MSKYTPATFQPTVRPDWAGVLTYLSDKEKGEILTALLKYPSDISEQCKSAYWVETIKPDLDLQYQTFVASCEAKSRGVRNRWGKISITDVKDKLKTSIRDDIDTEREREKESENSNSRDNIYNKTTTGVRGAFVEPSEKEVLEYAKQMDETVGFGGFKCSRYTAEQFWSHYQSCGWVGGNGVHLTDWKSKLKEWCIKNKMLEKEKMRM